MATEQPARQAIGDRVELSVERCIDERRPDVLTLNGSTDPPEGRRFGLPRHHPLELTRFCPRQRINRQVDDNRLTGDDSELLDSFGVEANSWLVPQLNEETRDARALIGPRKDDHRMVSTHFVERKLRASIVAVHHRLGDFQDANMALSLEELIDERPEELPGNGAREEH